MDELIERETETKAVSGHQGFVNEDDPNGSNDIEEPWCNVQSRFLIRLACSTHLFIYLDLCKQIKSRSQFSCFLDPFLSSQLHDLDLEKSRNDLMSFRCHKALNYKKIQIRSNIYTHDKKDLHIF